jgi:hypothetical protein
MPFLAVFETLILPVRKIAKNGIFVNFFNNFILAKKNTPEGYSVDVLTINNRIGIGVNLGIPPSQIPQAVTIQKVVLVRALIKNFVFVHFYFSFSFPFLVLL